MKILKVTTPLTQAHRQRVIVIILCGCVGVLLYWISETTRSCYPNEQSMDGIECER